MERPDPPLRKALSQLRTSVQRQSGSSTLARGLLAQGGGQQPSAVVAYLGRTPAV
jgi:hypothetical protein